MDSPHIPVLLDAVLDTFSDVKPGVFVDCTLGYGGHSNKILQHHPELRLIGIDRDDEALEFSIESLKGFQGRTRLIKGDFASVLPTLADEPITALLADFGVSSLQLDKPERGFGFESEVLDMRMDREAPKSAYDVVNTYTKERLQHIFDRYGEIKPAAKLAEEIIKKRSLHPVTSSKELSQIAGKVIRNKKNIHPATLMFQAIRIEVNDELKQIEMLLDTLEDMRPSGAVISLISFHSLEDRLVKHRFKRWERSCICDTNAMRCTCGNDHSLGTIHIRKPVVATNDEISINPRSRSAKLRTFIFRSK